MSNVFFTLTKGPEGLASQPEAATIVKANTYLVFQLDAATALNYMITGYYSNDSKAQLGNGKISEDGSSISILDVNNQPETININVDLQNRTSTEKLTIDPIVVNDPP